MRNRLITVFGGTGFIGRYVVRAPGRARRAHPGDQPQPERAWAAICSRWARSARSWSRALDLSSEAALRRGARRRARRGQPDRHPVRDRAPAVRRGPGRAARTDRRRGARRGRARAWCRSRRSAPIRPRPAPTPAARPRASAACARRFPSATILRPSIVFGPEDGFFNRFAAHGPHAAGAAADRRRPDPLPAGLCRRRRARRWSPRWSATTAPGQTYELGGPQVYTFAELMRYMLKVLGRRRLLLNVPFGVAALQARLLELLPEPPLTRDQVELLKQRQRGRAGHARPGRARHHADPDRADRAAVPRPLSGRARARGH